MRKWVRRVRARNAVRRWDGHSIPVPHPVKQQIVREHAEQNPHILVFVETGTFFGEMAAAASRWFAAVHTIELSPVLAEKARQQFSAFPKVKVYEGDSGTLLPSVLADIDEPVLFWLDAHYSFGVTARGDVDTPIEAELGCIFGRPHADIVLIDDARCFGRGDYPSIDRVRQMATAVGRRFEVDMDIIRIQS